MPPEEISITLEDMKSKKGLPRKSYSVEKTLKDLIDEIGYEGIEAATSKKKSSIQNISNPTYKERQLSHQDAIDLDVYCKKMGLGTPFLTAYATLLKKYTSDKKGHESTEIIINNLLRIGESIGDVMEETRKALNDDNVDEGEKEKTVKLCSRLKSYQWRSSWEKGDDSCFGRWSQHFTFRSSW